MDTNNHENDINCIIELIARFVFGPIIFAFIGIACIPSPACIIFFFAAVASIMIGVLVYFDIKSQKKTGKRCKTVKLKFAL